MPGWPLHCQCPGHQPTPLKLGGCQWINSLLHTMSSSIPSTGDKTLKGKSRNTKNSASWDLVTLLATRKKGKGVSVTEELDPKPISPTNGNSMPASGPVLTGPHLLDKTNPGEAALSPAASQSAKWMPAASRSMSAQPAAPRSTSNTKAAKALVKFQPFIEGESITLITDPAALLWVWISADKIQGQDIFFSQTPLSNTHQPHIYTPNYLRRSSNYFLASRWKVSQLWLARSPRTKFRTTR